MASFGGASSLGAVQVDVLLNTGQLQSQLTATEGTLKGASASMASSMAKNWTTSLGQVSAGFSKLKGVAMGLFGGGALFAGLDMLAQKTVDYGLSVEKLGATFGTTTNDAAEFKAIVEATGASADMMARVLVRLEGSFTKLGASTSSSAANLKSYGLSQDMLSVKTKGLVGVMNNLADAYQNAADKQAFIASVIGPRGMAVANAIAQWTTLRTAVEKMGIVWSDVVPSQENIQKFELMQLVFKNVALTIGNELLPFITSLGMNLANFLKDVSGGRNIISAFWDNFVSKTHGATKAILLFGAALTGAKIATAAWSITTGLVGLAKVMGTFASGALATTGIVALGPALLSVAAGLVVWKTGMDRVNESDQKFAAGLSLILGPIAPWIVKLTEGASVTEKLASATGSLLAVQAGAPSVLDRMITGVQGVTNASNLATGASISLGGALAPTKHQMDALYQSSVTLANSLLGIYGAMQNAASSAQALAAAQRKVNQMQAAGKTHSAAYRQAVADATSATFAAIQGQAGLTQALQDYENGTGSAIAKQKQAIAQLKLWAAGAGASASQTRAMVSALKEEIAKYEALNALPDINKNVTVHFSTTGNPSPILPGVVPRIAAGGIIQGASGFITRRPTMLVGEGSYATPFGRGSEAILPLTDATLARLGNAIAKAGGSSRPNVDSRSVTVNVAGLVQKPEDIVRQVEYAWKTRGW